MVTFSAVLMLPVLARSARALGLVQHVGSRRRCFGTALSAGDGSGEAQRVVFLGSPGVAALTLEALLDASAAGRGGGFEVVAAVSQPPAPKGRKRVLARSEVHELAEARGLECLTPASARDADFLAALEALRPDLCVTAAYGQFLPKAFLGIPRLGTYNIHPSLLPRWRGAAPLQRSLEAGDADVGVTVLQTVLKMDAGPVAAQVVRPVGADDDCESLLNELFETGARLLVDDVMPGLWAGEAELKKQDAALATEAPKLTKDEGALDLLGDTTKGGDCGRTLARRAADKVRAFTPWPGTHVPVALGGGSKVERLKILKARVFEGGDDDAASPPGGADLALAQIGKAIVLPCADGSVLELLAVQPANRKPMDAAAYWNGLRGEACTLAPPVAA